MQAPATNPHSEGLHGDEGQAQAGVRRQGECYSSPRCENIDCMKLFIKVGMFICCYCITYAILFVFEQLYFDPGQVKVSSLIPTYVHAPVTSHSILGPLPVRIDRRLRTDPAAHRRLVHVHLLKLLHAEALPGEGRILLPLLQLLHALVRRGADHHRDIEPHHFRVGQRKGGRN